MARESQHDGWIPTPGPSCGDENSSERHLNLKKISGNLPFEWKLFADCLVLDGKEPLKKSWMQEDRGR